MATFTTRANLTKPAGTEARSVVPLNANADLIDKFLGCILVNDGVIPPTGDLYDGAIVKERTSGKIWEARLNGGGTFDKVFIRFPYHIELDSNQNTIGNAIDGQMGADTAVFNTSQAKNSSVSQINGAGEWVCPIKGIYQVNMHIGVQANATGFRILKWGLNGAWLADDHNEVSVMANTGTNTRLQHNRSRLFAVGDRLVPGLYQTSGISLVARAYTTITMLEPVQ